VISWPRQRKDTTRVDSRLVSCLVNGASSEQSANNNNGGRGRRKTAAPDIRAVLYLVVGDVPNLKRKMGVVKRLEHLANMLSMRWLSLEVTALKPEPMRYQKWVTR